MSVFMHGSGSDVFRRYFDYAAKHWAGGTEDAPSPQGRVIAERVIFGVALGLGLLVLALSLAKMLSSSAGRRAFPELAARWAAGLLACWAVNRTMICIQSESVHFAQYGFVAFGLSYA